MDPLEELKALRRLAELEDKASGQTDAPGFMTQLGRGAASLADVTLGSVIPGAVQFGAYPFARMGRSPEEAQAAAKRIAAPFEQPFGRTFGVTETPQYQQESSRQLMDFIGQNFQKGAKFISEKTGLPQADIENMLGSATVAAPKVVQAAQPYVAPVMQQAAIGARLPFADRLQARAEAASLKDYARGPQIDAAANAQRLKIAIDPTNIEPSASSRFYSGMAGPRGPEALSTANRPRINEIARNELGLDPTTPLTSTAPFKQSRANLAGPYDEVKKLSTLTPDQTTIANLNSIRINEKIIGGEGVLKKVNKLVDDAVTKTQSGLTGAELLENVRTLRADAKKIYNNPSATPKQTSVADANLAIATELETMIDSNISNPKLLGEWRDARQKMARTYAYEGVTDFNTGMIDVAKLARITAKDNALTGDIAALGKIAGNFPEAFTTQATSKFYQLPRATRSGLAGGAGALIGANVAPLFDVTGITGSIFGGVAGGLLGEFGGKMAANRMANPNYQAGLTLSDMRIPVNQMATLMQPIPQNRAVVPYQAPVEVLQPGEGTYFPDFVMRPGGAGPLTTPGVAPGPAQIGMAQGPVGGQMGALRMEDVRARDLSMRQGAQAELQQAANEAATRQPTGQGTPLMFGSAGNLVEAPVGGPATTLAPTSLESAVQKLSGQVIKQPSTSYNTKTIAPKSGARPYTRIVKKEGEPTFERGVSRAFDLTAEERIAWEKTKVELFAAAPEFRKLSDKEIALKIINRQDKKYSAFRPGQKILSPDQEELLRLGRLYR